MRFFRFGTGARTLVILPGLSVQTDLPEHYSVYQMGLDTAAAMRALGLRDADIFGASQGGMMAQVIAIEAPELVRKLILGSTTSRFKPEDAPVFEEWLRLAGRHDGPALYDAFGKAIYPGRCSRSTAMRCGPRARP